MSTEFYLRNVKLKQAKLDSLKAIEHILLKYNLIYMTPEFEDAFSYIEDDIFIVKTTGGKAIFQTNDNFNNIEQLEDFYFSKDEWGKYDIVDCYDNSYTWDEFEERISPYVK